MYFFSPYRRASSMYWYCCSNSQNSTMHGAFPASFGSLTSIWEQKCMNSAGLKFLSVSKNSRPAFSLSPLRLSLTFADLNHWDYAFLRHACVGVDLKLTEQFYVAGGYNARRAYNMKTRNLTDNSESSHGAGFTVGAGLLLERFKLNVSYGKYHVNSSSIMFNAAINL